MLRVGYHLGVEPLLELGDPGGVPGEHVGIGDAAGSEVDRLGRRLPPAVL